MAAGAVTDSYEYDAYGNHWTAEGSTPNNMFYRGEEYDSDLSLVYLRARYMNPLTGRLVSMDPESGIITDPKTLHKYVYAGGDPVDRIDPSGRDSFAENLQTFTIAVGATAGLLAVQHEINCYYNWNGTNTGANVSAGAFGQVAQIGPCTWAGLTHAWNPEPFGPGRFAPPIFWFSSPPKNKRNGNCSAQDVETCQTLYPNCKGHLCGDCLNTCLTQCEWPFERPACNQWKFPKGWRDFPRPPKWIN